MKFLFDLFPVILFFAAFQLWDIYVATGVAALYANYVGRPLAIVDVCVYVALALTLASAFEYLRRVTRNDPQRPSSS